MRNEARSRAETAVDDEVPEDAAGPERRRAFRRRLPLGRGAVLLVGERAHIVGLADVSVSGAYLSTRAPVAAGERHVLRWLVMPSRVELVLKAEIVRVAQAEHESTAHPRGVAVRFVDVDAEARRHLEAFVAQGPRQRT